MKTKSLNPNTLEKAINKDNDRVGYEMMNLRYSLHAASDANECRHPQKVMQSLGITYDEATPQSMGDQWWFWCCSNVPEKLPEYLTELKLSPLEAIGYGLSKERATELKR